MAATLLLPTLDATPARADTTVQPLPFAQGWADTDLITTDDDWSTVPGVTGYRGDSEAAEGVDPATVTEDLSQQVDVNANRSSPDSFFSGGVTEFELADPVVALQGSSTADAPHLVTRVSTAGQRAIRVSYRLRDLDASDDDAVQAVALQYRTDLTAPYTNVPGGYVADATTGPHLAIQETSVTATLPSDGDDQGLVEVRILTTNASGSDEHVGVDDVSISGTPVPSDGDGDGVPDPADNCPAAGNPDQVDLDRDGAGDPCDADDDNDSVADPADNCPLWPNPSQADADGSGGGDACDADDDDDGLGDAAESRAGSSRLDRDSDDDGLGDRREVKGTRTDPTERDTDEDALADGLERGLTAGVADPPGVVRGTDPRRFRPDRDPASRTDVRRRDTDRDGLSDGAEDRNRNGRRERGETDPRRRDTDGDGRRDGRDPRPLRH